MRRAKSSGLILLLLLSIATSFLGFEVCAEKPEITVLMSSLRVATRGNYAVFTDEYEKISGVKLNLIDAFTSNRKTQYVEKFVDAELDEIPDAIELENIFFSIPYYTNYLSVLSQKEKIFPLDEYISESKACKNIPKKVLKLFEINGKNYIIPLGLGSGYVAYIRKDWLDNLGLSVPKTWNEFYNVLQLFTNGDPDKNGQNDTIGMSFSSEGISFLNNVNFFCGGTYRIDGKLYGFPLQRGIASVTYIRKDWLDKLGLDIPKTWEEYMEVLRQFTFNDPDGNGKNDTYGTSFVRTLHYTNIFAYAEFFQGSHCDFKKENGIWVDGFMSEEFKAALKRMKAAYDEGIIYPEKVLYLSWGVDLFYANKIGAFTFSDGLSLASFQKNMDNKSAEFVAMPALKESTHLRVPAPVFVINKDVKDPKFVFDNTIALMNDGGKGQLLFTHGVEGVHYNMVDGKLSEKLNGFRCALLWEGKSLKDWNDIQIKTAAEKELSKDIEQNYTYLPIPPYRGIHLKNANKILALRSEVMEKIISNKAYSVEEGLDYYRNEMKKLQVDQILKEFNAAK